MKPLEPEEPVSTDPRVSQFPPTLWTVVFEAADPTSPRAAEALGQLCVRYHRPIVAWLVRRGESQDRAEDLAQGFIEFLLHRNRFAGFTRREVKFRSFLLEHLTRFVRDQWRKEQAEKRGGGAMPEEFDDSTTAQFTSPDPQLDVEVAVDIHCRVLAMLAEKHKTSGKADRYALLKGFVLGTQGDVSYAELAPRLSLKPNAVKKAVFDLRDQYSRLFREEVAHIAARDAVDEEMRYLVSLLAQATPEQLV